MYPRFGFRSGGTSECTLVLVFVPGEHLPKPPFWKPPFWKPPLKVIVKLVFKGYLSSTSKSNLRTFKNL